MGPSRRGEPRAVGHQVWRPVTLVKDDSCTGPQSRRPQHRRSREPLRASASRLLALPDAALGAWRSHPIRRIRLLRQVHRPAVASPCRWPAGKPVLWGHVRLPTRPGAAPRLRAGTPHHCRTIPASGLRHGHRTRDDIYGVLDTGHACQASGSPPDILKSAWGEPGRSSWSIPGALRTRPWTRIAATSDGPSTPWRSASERDWEPRSRAFTTPASHPEGCSRGELRWPSGGAAGFYDGCQTIYLFDGEVVGHPTVSLEKERISGQKMEPFALVIQDDRCTGRGLAVRHEAAEAKREKAPAEEGFAETMALIVELLRRQAGDERE